ncbi:helix-turn-helix domain-containing protein [Pararhizobium sp. O133]|uniref:helix-turn-helix domain-containing protein n=1 Tax=Pararhizobium sp. O133 TaxID=3449278 RepID=UPI003F68503A
MSIVSREDRLPFVTAHMATYIRVRRHELGLSLDQLAERCGSSKSHVWALERRQSKNPTLWLILSLCDGLQCSLNSLIGADVSQPMFSEQEMALVDAHRRIFLASGPTFNPDIPNDKSSPPQDHVRGGELLATIKEFARWHHLNEMTIAAGKTPSDSEIDFEAMAWNRITRALKSEGSTDE